MASISTSLLNMTTEHSKTSTKPHNSEFCPPFPNAVFETLDSSVPYLVNAALNVPLAIATTLANLLVLLAMRHVASIHLPSKLLLCSLVLTDLGVGLVAQSQFIAFLLRKAIHPHNAHSCSLFRSSRFTESLFAGSSMLTITAISLDRYTALFFHLKYQQIVTARRVCAVLTLIWPLSLVFALSNFWNRAFWRVSFLTVLPICLLVSFVSYFKIYRRLRGQQGQQVQPQPNDQAQQQVGSTLNMAKYKRTASTMMWIYVLFVIWFLHSLFAVSITSSIEYNVLTHCVREFAYTVLLLNSCLNPIVYCLRLPEIRTEVVKELRQFCCRSPQQQNTETN